MASETRRLLLDAIFANIDGTQKELIDPLLDEIVFLEQRMKELKQMPFITTHPRKPHMQKTTPAAKQYKECSQSYMNAIRILVSILRQQEISEQDEMLKRLEEFMAT